MPADHDKQPKNEKAKDKKKRHLPFWVIPLGLLLVLVIGGSYVYNLFEKEPAPDEDKKVSIEDMLEEETGGKQATSTANGQAATSTASEVDPEGEAAAKLIASINSQAKEQGWLDKLINSTNTVNGAFAKYEQAAVKVTPKVPAYTVQPGLSNVENAGSFKLSDEAKSALAKNGFVAVQSSEQEFYPIYEANRYAEIPNFVSADAMLHNYHLMFNHSLETVEREKMIPMLWKLNQNLMDQATVQYLNLKGTEWETAAKRNLGFFAVGSKLLDPSSIIPVFVQEDVDRELRLIKAFGEIKTSPIMGTEEDYTQYVPRGHYDKDEAMRAYFKSMMWYGRMGFPLRNIEGVKSSVLISKLLDSGPNAKLWKTLYDPITFMVGNGDDNDYPEMSGWVKTVYGDEADVKKIASDQDSLSKIKELIDKEEKLPSIARTLGPTFRFMGQRYTLDAEVFDNLMHDRVGQRMLPKALDIPAALGSKTAESVFRPAEEKQYPAYGGKLEEMKKLVAGIKPETWVSNLYYGWLHAMRPLLSVAGDGYPSFMKNEAWAKKSLGAFLGGWTELKHDTILYAKQAYAEMGGGPEEKQPKVVRGYVEPNPELYARLAALSKMTRTGLANRGLLDDGTSAGLKLMEDLASKLKAISEKELSLTALSEEDYELINTIGGQLETIWVSSLSTPGDSNLSDNPASLVADVATGGDVVLEEGVGDVADIYVVVPIEGKLYLTKGGAFTHYEFSWPSDDRLTDKKWREILSSDKAPAMAAWMDYFKK